jgi:hypothetical protein
VLTGEEIRSRLTAFAARWSVYEGTERSEAQTFLNELFACYGTDRSEVAHFEEFQAGRFVDLIWPRVCLFEMKAPGEAKRLSKHREQALQYWRESADPETNTPAPPYVVLCAFSKLEIWEPGSYPGAPRVVLDLIDLPDQYDSLLFLAGKDAVFAGGQARLTREAVVHLVDLYEQLSERRAADPDVMRDFLLQCVWCLFAEDLGQIPEHRFMRILEELIAQPQRSSADDLGGLFEWLNTPGDRRPEQGLYAGTPYANGGLFESPAHVHLSVEELKHLRDAAQFQWRDVQPSIFGSLLEGGLGHDQQWRLSAHYTHEADIQKVVQPTIVEPWRERIENLKTHAEVVAAQYDLLNYVVLDPACGSGNFLYVAYRELRRLEKRLHERGVELRRKGGLKEPDSLSLHFPLSNMKGIEIESFAVALARVTLWMGHKLAVDELDLPESTLPLADLSGIQIGDALRIPWPRADAIIGNPPFHGASNLRSTLGDEYVEWLKSEFGIGVKDYCVYWFRKAHEKLEPGGRAGLVGTNSISQNFGRGVSLAYIAKHGGVITSAVSSQDWPGEAAVDVSIVNWTNNPTHIPKRYVLDGKDVSGITTSLRPTSLADISTATRLTPNRGLSFEGVKPGGIGFILDDIEAERLIAATDADYATVVRPYLVGDDIVKDPRQAPTRWVIDFATMSLEEAMTLPTALRIVRSRVKPVRDKNRRKIRRERWWLFSEPVPAMRAAFRGLHRFIASNAQGKRLLFCWCEPRVCPSNLTKVFALEDDYSFGVLSSTIHERWARAQSSTLEDRLRYTPTTAFETFPWPDPITDAQRDAIAELARKIVARRQEICLERQIGLTRLYNEVDDGAYADLATLHRKLDEAVCAAYGWPRSIAGDPDETNARLLALNQEIAAGKRPYDPFGRLHEPKS